MLCKCGVNFFCWDLIEPHCLYSCLYWALHLELLDRDEWPARSTGKIWITWRAGFALSEKNTRQNCNFTKGKNKCNSRLKQARSRPGKASVSLSRWSQKTGSKFFQNQPLRAEWIARHCGNSHVWIIIILLLSFSYDNVSFVLWMENIFNVNVIITFRWSNMS